MSEIIKEQHIMEKCADRKDVLGVVCALRRQPSWSSSCLDDRLSALEGTYLTMLAFYSSGAPDPQRDDIVHRVLVDLFDVIYQWVDYELEKACSTSLRCRKKDGLGVCDAISRLDVLHENGDISEELAVTRDLFDVIWTSRLNRQDALMLCEYIDNKKFSLSNRCIVVGGVIFALSQRFVPHMFDVLLHGCESSDDVIKSRSSVGLMLSLICHSDRVMMLPELYSRLKMMEDDAGMRRDLLTSFLVLLKSSQTKSIVEKVNTEITPELLSARVNLNKIVDADIMSDWEELSSSSPKLRKDLDKLQKWQSEGADVMLSTFSHLKDCSIFRHLSGWLKPFDEKDPDVEDASMVIAENSRREFVARIAKSRMLCDSDKYSVMLTLKYVSSDMIDMLCASYSQQLESFEEVSDVDNDDTLEQIRANQFVHDLYRLYFVHPRKHEFVNPFEMIGDFVSKSQLMDMFFSIEEKEIVADFLGEHEQYQYAKAVYERLMSCGDTGSGVNDRLVYCYVSCREYAKALSLIKRLDLVNGLTYWRQKMKAQCYRELEMFDEEKDVLVTMVEMKPEEVAVKNMLAKCYERLGKYEEELKLLFEIDYMKPTSASACKTVECLLRLGQMERAEPYASRMSDSAECMTIMAVMAMCNKKQLEAIDILAGMDWKKIEAFPNEYDKYRMAFVAAGVDKNSLRYVTDFALISK